MNTIILGCGVLSGAVFLVGQAFADDPQFAAIQGTWKVASSTMDGKPFVDRETSELQLTLSRDEMVLDGGDGSKRERFRVKPEAGSTPQALHITRIEPPNPPQSGWLLYELKGDRLRVAFFDALKGRPPSFEPLPKLIVLELEKIAETHRP